MSTASRLLRATVDGESAVLSKCVYNRVFDFGVIGSSLPMSVDPGSFVSSCAFALERDGVRDGVIAVAMSGELIAECGKNSHFYNAAEDAFIPITKKDDGIWRAELNSPFVPKSDRLPQIVDRRYIEVRTKEYGTFTTKPNVPGTKYVKDANLLCRFLVDDAKVEDLNAAAEEVAAEEAKIASLFMQNEELQAALQAAEQRIRELEVTSERLDQKLYELEHEYPDFKGTYIEWISFGVDANGFIASLWFKSQRARDLMKRYKKFCKD